MWPRVGFEEFIKTKLGEPKTHGLLAKNAALFKLALFRFAENFNLQRLNYFPISISHFAAVRLHNESREIPSYEFIALPCFLFKMFMSLICDYLAAYYSRFHRQENHCREITRINIAGN